MLTPLILTIIILAVVRIAIGPIAGHELIVHRPYNNRYNDASGAREDHLG